jgi:hypothetical protein
VRTAPDLRQRGGTLVKGEPLTDGNRERTPGEKLDEVAEPPAVRGDLHRENGDVSLGRWRVRCDGG